MKMTARQKVATTCAVLILGTAIGWVSTKIPTPSPPQEPKITASTTATVHLSAKALQEIAEIIEESP